MCLSATLGYPGKSTHPAQRPWPDLSTWLPPHSEARTVSCLSFLWSSPYSSQKAEEGSQIYADPLPEHQVSDVMGDVT